MSTGRTEIIIECCSSWNIYPLYIWLSFNQYHLIVDLMFTLKNTSNMSRAIGTCSSPASRCTGTLNFRLSRSQSGQHRPELLSANRCATVSDMPDQTTVFLVGESDFHRQVAAPLHS